MCPNGMGAFSITLCSAGDLIVGVCVWLVAHLCITLYLPLALILKQNKNADVNNLPENVTSIYQQ